MEEIRVEFKVAELAKQKGFNFSCNECYDNNGESYIWDLYSWFDSKRNEYFEIKDSISKPTQSTLQKWLRDKYKIRVYVENKTSGKFCFSIYTATEDIGKPWERHSYFTLEFDTYEEALEQGLFEGLNLIL